MIQTAAIDTTIFRLDAISLTTTDATRRLIKLAKAKAGAAIKLGVVAVLSPVVSFSVMCGVGGAMYLVFI
jgi:hypothetical protein